jgi:hypothetical protein
VFENTVPRDIFGRVREEITGEWRELQNEEIFLFYCSPNVIRANKWRWKRWVGHVVGKRGRGEEGIQGFS